MTWNVLPDIIEPAAPEIWLSFFTFLKLGILLFFKQFDETGLFLYPLTTSENHWFSDIFKGYRKNSVAWTTNGAKYSRIDQVKFLKAIFNKFYLVHSWIRCPKFSCNTK